MFQTNIQKIKVVGYYLKQKNQCNHKIKIVKYLELIDQNKIRLFLTPPQQCEN